LGAEVLAINIFGVAGLLVGMCKLRGLKGLCLLSETSGNFPDKEAAKELLKALSHILKIKIDVNDLGDPRDLISVLSPFDFGALSKIREKKAEPEWFI
ncbi:PAC2 family protein, partial [Candidatus Bathyarchaeota archaeon]|nr:PAC2 family protein [Candidatus Bathyarchaeota archaeon]